MVFTVERSNTAGGWDVMIASAEPVTLADTHRPLSEYPVNYKQPAFSGLPGMQARIRFGETELERYVWDHVPENPNEPGSFMIPGWKLTEKHPLPEGATAASWMSSMSATMPFARIETGETAPKGNASVGTVFEPKPMQPSPRSPVAGLTPRWFAFTPLARP